MKLARFQSDHGRIGLVLDDELLDLEAAIPELPGSMPALLENLDELRPAIERAQRSGQGRIPLSEARLLAPVERPPKFLAVGVNYSSHAEEASLEAPADPLVFNKQSTCVVGPEDQIFRPLASEQLDYEGELAFVIGRRCRHVPRDRAAEVIGGYMVTNDVSVRDWQLRSPTWTMGKSWDTHGPIGPWIVTPDELPDPHGLDVRTWVNGELRQDGNTRDLIFDCFAQVEALSRVFTLEPGDVIATGTPAGVGALMEPPAWLAAGDVVRVEIGGIGRIENEVIDEPNDAPMVGAKEM